MGIPPQNDDAPYSHPHPNVDQFLGPFPQQAYCPTCKQHTLTEVKYVSGLLTWILVFVFIIFDLFVVAVSYRFVLIAVKIANIAVLSVILILGHINVFLEVLEVIKGMLLL
uniref:LITAF domain-containing protein n=1 Tax=Meloidogyne enterolobii TaxID=390850 RepID=A0A6V7UCN4_MELEN|nr:unnamed protein product [Meloidogyne enterolobii]